MLLQSREKILETTLSAFGKIVNLNCSPQYPLIRNKHEFNKNLQAMTSTINAQFPKKVINVMVYVKMRPTPPLKIGNETCQRAIGAFGHSKELGL
jgi:hypothetical protein